MKSYEYNIKVTFGSDFQEQVYGPMLFKYIIMLLAQMKNTHSKNDIVIKLINKDNK